MATRKQLKHLALLRRRETQVLYEAELYDGSRDDVRDILEAVDEVFRWIKKYW